MNTNPTGAVIGFPPRCSRSHCKNAASGQAVIRIPAMGCFPEHGGCTIPEHQALKIPTGIKLCADHMSTVKAGEFMSLKLKRIVLGVCKRTKGAKPDFKRAFIEPGDLPANPLTLCG